MLLANYFHQGANKEPKATATLTKQIQDQLERGNSVTSASGFTAAIALNICETKGWQYTLVQLHGMYHLQLQRGQPWTKIAEQEPPQKKLLLVCGRSGYRTHQQFLTLAFYDESYRPRLEDGRIRWLDVTNDALLDKGWTPTHWSYHIEIVMPPLEEML